MNRCEEFFYWLLGLAGAGLALAIEWSWQGGWPVALMGLVLMLILSIGFAFVGKFIGGFIYDELVDPDGRRPRYATKNFPAQEG